MVKTLNFNVEECPYSYIELTDKSLVDVWKP